MHRLRSFRSTGIRILFFAGTLVCALPAAAQNAVQVQVPTLEKVGMATLAGALIMAGAWVLSRNRNNKQ